MMIDLPGTALNERAICSYLRRCAEKLNIIFSELEDSDKNLSESHEQEQAKQKEAYEAAMARVIALEEKCTSIEARCDEMKEDIRQIKLTLSRM